MKIAVVQTAGSLHDTDPPPVIDVCIRSVKAWCKAVGVEHCLVPQPDTHYSIFRHPDYNRGLRKYEVCAQVADQYDYIIYLDADMFCWGNPTVPIDKDYFFSIRKSLQSSYPTYDGRPTAHGYFFSGASHWFKDLYSWIQDQLDESTRCPGVTSDCYLEWNCPTWSREELNSYPKGMLFHDEVMIRHWLHERQQSVRWVKPHTIISDMFHPGDISPKRFFHYVGPHKDKQHAQMWPIYHAYKHDRALYEGWRDSRDLVIREYVSSY